MTRPQAASVRVWDAGLRLFHWGLVAGVTVAGVTGFILGRTWLAWHLLAGEAVMAALAWRVVWGFAGPTHARFAGFAYSPVVVLAYLRRSRRYLGHNPLGAMMVFALLSVLVAIGVTGVVGLGGLLKQGPLRAFLTYETGVQVETWHKYLAILLLTLVGAHVAGVAFESWHGGENLVGAMVTGRKRRGGAAASPRMARPGVAGMITVAVLGVAVAGVVGLSSMPGWGVPPAALDPVFAEQCGACHLAFPPSLAPAATWDGILADLGHHFGNDATLSPEQIGQIRAWVDANAAGNWDTLPAHVLGVAAGGSLRITDTPGWRRLHRDIAPAVFAAAPVYRKSNCAACHRDADTARFSPQEISVGTRPNG